MTLRRRQLLQAVAMSPILLFAPGLAQRVLAHGPTTTARGGLRVPTPTGGGISMSWKADASSESVGSIRALVDGVWSAPITVHPDHHHGPEISDGRVHGQAILVPDAEMYEIAPNSKQFSYNVHPIEAPSRRLTRLADDGLSHIEPIPGLQIIERSNWTMRPRKDTIDCVIGSSVYGRGCRSDVGIRHAVVHHTVNINNYAMGDVPELLEGIQRYHMFTRGWDDIAYNFVIDRFGRIWQAREAELFAPITGGHTTGLNAESVGVALLGTFTDLDPGQAVIDSLGTLLGWKLGLHGVDPLGVTEVRSSGGDFAQPGDMVLVDNVSSHRDNQSTRCPGNGTVARLDEVRHAAAEFVTIFGTVVPKYFLDRVELKGWAIDRFTPGEAVDINFVIDGKETVVAASERVAGLDSQYPDAGTDHGFTSTVPIDIDTTSITATAVAGDGRAAELLNLSMFATFIDVEPERFFAPGIFWLRKNELTFGTLPGLFEPMDHLSRAQMAAFLWRFMDKPAVETKAPFADVARPSWYASATDWLYASGITKGVTPDLFAPEDFVTRGQMAAFLWRLCGSIPAQEAAPFNDVGPGSYYATAVAWIAETRVTVGATPSLFAPDQKITRGEMATFMHRLATTPEAWAAVEPPSVV
jgi:hypothetical protein